MQEYLAPRWNNFKNILINKYFLDSYLNIVNMKWGLNGPLLETIFIKKLTSFFRCKSRHLWKRYICIVGHWPIGVMAVWRGTYAYTLDGFFIPEYHPKQFCNCDTMESWFARIDKMLVANDFLYLYSRFSANISYSLVLHELIWSCWGVCFSKAFFFWE